MKDYINKQEATTRLHPFPSYKHIHKTLTTSSAKTPRIQSPKQSKQNITLYPK
jgi:hypothetical protein